MTIDQVEIPRGSLSDYINARWNDIYKKEGSEEEQKARELKAQQAVSKKTRLLDQNTPIGKLFSRFRVLELLEEVQSKYWKDNSGFVFFDDGTGVALVQRSHGGADMKIKAFARVMTHPGYYHYTSSPGYSSYAGLPTYETIQCANWIPINAIRTITVEAVRSESADSAFNHDLLYSYHLRRRDLTNRKDDRLDLDKYLTPKTRILANDPPEVLMQMIGDEIIKDILHGSGDKRVAYRSWWDREVYW